MKESSVQIEEKYPELGKLIQTGKERGFIMYEELYENLPEEVTGIAEELDDIYMRLSELDIDVMDSGNSDSDNREAGARPKNAVEKTTTAKVVETRPVATEQLEKTNDPVRMYLREMGTVKLLDRVNNFGLSQPQRFLYFIPCSTVQFFYNLQYLAVNGIERRGSVNIYIHPGIFFPYITDPASYKASL